MSRRKKAKSSPESQVPEVQKSQKAGNLPPEIGTNLPLEEVNVAPNPEVQKPPEDGPQAPDPVLRLHEEVGNSNNVDMPAPGYKIVLKANDPEVLDATLEEPDYPAHEWQDKPELPIIVPNSNMPDDNLVAFVHERQGLINYRLRKTVQDYWLIGKALHVLYERHDKEKEGPDGTKIKSRWRDDWLPKLGYNHTTDQQLRALATEFNIEEIGQFSNKTKALQALGFSVGGAKKAIEHEKKEEAQPGTQGGEVQEIAKPPEVKNQVAPQVATNPQPHAKIEPEPKATPQPVVKATPENKIAAQANPEVVPVEKDPVDGTEAVIVTLEGSEISEIEAVVAESGFTFVAKTQDKIVGMMWYAEETSQMARARVNKALGRLRAEKKNLHVEAHYLVLNEIIPV